ncbi:MAG: ATP-grasp fold amidoligase family protein [Bdellovibrionales bacterium]
MNWRKFFRPLYRPLLDILPPKWNAIAHYIYIHKTIPNLAAPRGFNEKIVWRKLYDRDPRMPDMVDKIKVKAIIANRFGPSAVIPALRVYESADAMNFKDWPLNKPPYVIKANHGSGMNLFVRDANDIADPKSLRAKCEEFLNRDHAAEVEEWAYAPVQRRIFVEPYIDIPQGGLTDYKFHVFSGKIFGVEVVTDRYGHYNITFMNRAWEPMDIRVYAKRPHAQTPPPKPPEYAKMVAMAEEIGKKFPYIRVDLYDINGIPTFGEATFYPSGGHDSFDPPEWDRIFGDQWIQDWTQRKQSS